MTEIAIRKLARSDAANARALVAGDPDAYRRHFHAVDADFEDEVGAAERDRYWAIVADDALAGIVMLRGLDAGFAAPAFGVYVAQAWSGKGLAALALAHAEAWCRVNEIAELMLTVDPDHEVAVRLYERSGFAFAGDHSERGHRIYRKLLA
jgi:RimJ/RimL family protein N-acetyltransferase